MSTSEMWTIMGTYFGVLLVFGVIWIIANWRIYSKAGEAGWKCIIPIYNTYVLYKFTWKTLFFWIFWISNIAISMLNYFGGTNKIVAVIVLCLSLLSIVLAIIQMHKLSVSFGHGVGFTLGLIFLNPIFTLILAFGSSEYIGAQD
ncbi:MAG: DUF5684 domain-containing protein [Lachnospiraceae bacterium]|nr:DUF5684 domain-containing protein [Lachnospiraceae bacterium]MDD3616823.1 DUF5684 domain-containing protein [Lachnospiraceae bacterium]